MAMTLGELQWKMGIDRQDFDRDLDDAGRKAEDFGHKTSSGFNALTVAAGNLLAQGITALARGFTGLLGQALSVTGEYETMTLSMEALAKRDLMAAGTVESTIVTGQQLVGVTEAQTGATAELLLKKDLLMAQMQEEQQRHYDLIAKWGEEGLAVQTHAAKMAIQANNLAELNALMQDTAGSAGQLVDVTKSVITETLSDAQAKLMAKDAAQELLVWIHKLAVESPFDEAGAKAALQTALTYGFMTDQAKALAIEVGKINEEQAKGTITAQQLAQTSIDFAAATGQSSDVMNAIARALGQMKQAGKVTGQDIMQLTNVGVDAMGYIAKAMQITKAEAMELRTKGLLPADAAIQAIIEGLQKDFGGAAKKQTETWEGLISTLKETKTLALREFFAGTFKALKPLTVGLVNFISNPKFIAGLKSMGEILGKKVAWGVESIQGLMALPGIISELAALPDGFRNMAELDAIMGKLPESMRGLAEAGVKLVKAFRENGLMGAVDVIKGWAGDAWNKIRDWWDTNGSKWVEEVAGKITKWVKAIPGKLAKGADLAGNLLKDAWNAAKDWWDTGGEAWVKDAAKKIKDWLAKIPEKIKTAGAAAGAWLAGVWNSMKEWWDTGGEQWATDTAKSIKKWLDTIPDKLLTAGMDAGAWLADTWLSMKSWWDTDGEAWATGIADQIKKWGKTIGDFLKSGEGGVLVQEATLWLEDVWNGIAKWWDIYTGGLTTKTVEGIDYWITNTLVPALKETDKTKWSAGLGEAIMLGFAGVDEWVKLNQDQISYDVGYTLGSIILLGIKGVVQALSTLASDPITLIFKQWQEQGFAAKEGGGLDLGWLTDMTAQMATGIEDAFKNDEIVQRLWAQGAAIVKIIADGMAGGWATAIERWSGRFLDAGGELIKGVAKGITQWSVKAVEAIEAAAADIVTGIKKFFGIESPSTVMAGIGAEIVAGLKAGIVEASTDFLKWIIGWAQRIIPKPLWQFFGIESPSKLMAEMGRNLVYGLAAGIEDAGSSAANAMASVMGGLSGGGSMRFSPAFASGASGGSLNGGGLPGITVNIYAAGGGPDQVRQAANTGVMEALRAGGRR